MNDSPPTASLPSASRIKSFAIPPPLSALSSHTPMPTPHRPPFTPLTSQLNIPTWSPLTTSKPIPPLNFTPVQSHVMFSPVQQDKPTHIIPRPILTSSLDASLDTSHAINIASSPASISVSPTPVDTSLDVLLTRPVTTISPSTVTFSPIRDNADKENVVISPPRHINDEMPLFSPMPGTHVSSSVPSTPAPAMAPITSLTPTTTSPEHPLYQLHRELNTIHSPSSPSIHVDMPIASSDLSRVELRRTSDTERMNVHVHPDVDTSCIVTDTNLLNQSYTSDIDTSICSEMATGAPASTPNVSAFGLLSTSIMDQSVLVSSAPASPMHTLTSAPLMFSPILDISRADISMIQPSTPTLDVLHQHVTSWCHTLETRLTPWDNRYQALQQIRECCISSSIWSSVSQYDMSMALFPLLVPLQT